MLKKIEKILPGYAFVPLLSALLVNMAVYVGAPVRRIRQFDVRETGPWSHTETPKETPADSLVREAQAFYQTVNLKPW